MIKRLYFSSSKATINKYNSPKNIVTIIPPEKKTSTIIKGTSGKKEINKI